MLKVKCFNRYYLIDFENEALSEYSYSELFREREFLISIVSYIETRKLSERI